MQKIRLNKKEDVKTRVIIISHLDLDGIMSAYLCDIGVRGVMNLSKDEVQVVGDFNPSNTATTAALKQTLYKLNTADQLSIFILDRSNMTAKEISELLEDGWLQPHWKITCIDHHGTNFKPEEYANLPITVNQIVNTSASAAMNIVNYFESVVHFNYPAKIKELARLTSIYDRFAWLTEKISEIDEKNAKYLNRVCSTMHRCDFIDFIEKTDIPTILETGKSVSTVTSMMVRKLYKELLDDENDFLIHNFKNESQELKVVFIRKSIDYLYTSELCETIFEENKDIHLIVLMDATLGGLSLRSRESGKYLNITEMINTLHLQGGGHPGAGGYFGIVETTKKDLINDLYNKQSRMLAYAVSCIMSFGSYKYLGGETFYGMAKDQENSLKMLTYAFK